jgi:hypothetical protein
MTALAEMSGKRRASLAKVQHLARSLIGSCRKPRGRREMPETRADRRHLLRSSHPRRRAKSRELSDYLPGGRAAMPQDIDRAVARRREARCPARLPRLSVGTAYAARRRAIARPPAPGPGIEDGAPDRHLLHERKGASLACRLRPEPGRPGIPRPKSTKGEPTPERAMSKIAAVVVEVGTALLRIAQRGAQAGETPGRNRFEERRIRACQCRRPPSVRYSSMNVWKPP